MGWGGLGVVEGMGRSWGSGGGGSWTPSGVSLVSRITWGGRGLGVVGKESP